jgi:hypothetical protein
VDLIRYEAPGGRTGYLEDATGLKPVLRELVRSSGSEDVVIDLEVIGEAWMRADQHAWSATMLPRQIGEYYGLMVWRNQA